MFYVSCYREENFAELEFSNSSIPSRNTHRRLRLSPIAIEERFVDSLLGTKLGLIENISFGVEITGGKKVKEDVAVL